MQNNIIEVSFDRSLSVIDLAAKVTTREEFQEQMLENDVCPTKFNLIDKCSKISCKECWNSSLSKFNFIGDEVKC